MQEYKKKNSIETHYARVSLLRARTTTTGADIKNNFSVQAECEEKYEEEKTLIAHLFRTKEVINVAADGAMESALHYYGIRKIRNRRHKKIENKKNLNIYEDLTKGKENVWLIQLLRNSDTNNVCTSVAQVYRILSHSVDLFVQDGNAKNGGVRFERKGFTYIVSNVANNKAVDRDNELFNRIDDRTPVILTQYSFEALRKILVA
jgi:hypothetical protein